MSDTRVEGWNHLLWPISAATVVAVLPWNRIGVPTITKETELAIVYALTAVSTVTHVHYSCGVVSIDGFLVLSNEKRHAN